LLYVHDGMTSITVRIPDDLKKEIETLGVKVSEVTHTALENEVKRQAKDAAEKLGRLLVNVSDGEIIRAVREGRDER